MKVYISSTFKDLEEYRDSVRIAIQRLRNTTVMMEHYTADSQTPLDKCLSDVSESDIYIGIIAWRYGFIPNEEEKSITELEYRQAQKSNIPTLIFLIDQNQPWLKQYIDTGNIADKLNNFKKELKENNTVDFFTTPDDLASKVTASLANFSHGSKKGEDTNKKAAADKSEVNDQPKRIELSEGHASSLPLTVQQMKSKITLFEGTIQMGVKLEDLINYSHLNIIIFCYKWDKFEIALYLPSIDGTFSLNCLHYDEDFSTLREFRLPLPVPMLKGNGIVQVVYSKSKTSIIVMTKKGDLIGRANSSHGYSKKC